MKLQNLIISILLIILWGGCFTLISSKGNHPLGFSFSIFVWVMITMIMALTTGVLLCILRFLKKIRTATNLYYMLTGLVNFVVGSLFIALGFFGNSSLTLRLEFLPSLIIGSFILYDIAAFS